MFAKYLRKLTNSLRLPTAKSTTKRWNSVLLLETLESRDVPAPLTWAAGVNLPGAQGGLVAQPQGTGLLVLGGTTTTSYNLSATDPTWQASITPTVQTLNFPRSSPGVGPLPNGYFIVFGGTQNGFAVPDVTQYDPNTVTVGDGATNQTRSLHAMNTPRQLLGWATDASDISYAIGGEDNNGTPLATMEAYNPTANSWKFLASLPQTLYGASALSDGAGYLYTFGGVGAGGAILNNVYRYTIATNTWDQVAPLQIGVSNSAAVLGPNGLIYVLGGTTAAGTTATVESYNIAANTWALESSLPLPVSSEAAVVDSLGRIEVIGGNDAYGNPSAAISVSQKLAAPDQAPTITSTAGKAAVVNTAYGYQVLSTANPQATYALTAAPAGMTINSSTGLISWTPTYATEGSPTVTVVASNSLGQATQTFTVGVAPQVPTGLTAVGTSTTSIMLSWNASADPNVTGYEIYRGYVYHSPRGSGGGINYLPFALVSSNAVTIAGSSSSSVAGNYLITAVNSAGVQSAKTAAIHAATQAAPDLFTATTTSGADISSLTLQVGQTGQIYLVQEFANPAPTFSLVHGPSNITVDPTTGLVSYTPGAADIGYQFATFAATNSAGSSTYTFLYDVLALNPTVTLSGGPFTYDGNAHGDSATAVGTDGVSPVAGSFTFTYDGDPNPPTVAGTYAVTATFTSADPSYANATATGSLTINPAAPTVTVNAGPFDYDGNAHPATATAVGVDGLTAVDGSFQFTYDGDSTAPTGPGLYAVTSVFVSNDPNYASVTVTSDLIINSPGTLTPTLTLVDASAPYDGTAHADTASAVGVDNVTSVAGTFVLTYNGSATAPTEAGTYAVTANFISSDIDYANATIAGTMTIGAVAPTLTIDPTPFYYDGTGHDAVLVALGVDQVTPVDGTFSVTYNGSSALPVDAGTYAVTVSFTSNDPNYVATTTTGSITILPATPSVGLQDGAWYYTYNGTPQGVTGSAVGIDGLTPIAGYFTYAYYNEYGSNTMLFGPPLDGPPTDAGYYTFTEYFTSQDPNYADGSFSWDLSINPASPTVSINSTPWTYNGAAPTSFVTALGIDGVTPIAGSVTYATYNGSTTVPTTAGTYAVFAEFTSSDPNYYSSEASGTFVITKATPAFSSLSSPAVNYGTSTVTLSGHLAAGSVAPGGDDVAITLNGVTKAVPIGNNGSFSTSFNIQGLPTGTYSISYEYLGDGARFNAAGSGMASGTLTIQAAPGIVSSPVSQTVVSGSAVTFTASASGYPVPTVQWQQSTSGTTYTNIAGATSPSYTISAVTANQNGYHYRAVFTNSVGSATSAAATLTVQFAPTITTNPSNTTVTAGQTATLTAAASGNPAPSVQWQMSSDGGNTFTNIAGATSATLTLTGTMSAQNGTLYHAMFTNSVGSATTASALLTVRYAPVVSASPSNHTVNAGQSVTFTASAAGNPAPTVQWQVSTDGGTSFSNISGATSTTLTLASATASQNGYKYRAVFTNSVGSATTTAATLTVQYGPTVTGSPTSQTVNAGQGATFTAVATGNPAVSVQWQVSTDGGATYGNITGANSTSLTLGSVTASQNGYKYRAVFTNVLGSATTTAATLTVRYGPMVATNPVSQSVAAGHPVTFSAAATGNPTPTVQWQLSTDGGVTFTSIAGAVSLSFTINSPTASQNGYYYRAVFTNSLGTATTTAAILTVH